MGLDLAGSEDQEEDDSPLDKDEFVVKKLIGICYGGTGRENGVYFKVHMCYLRASIANYTCTITKILSPSSATTFCFFW